MNFKSIKFFSRGCIHCGVAVEGNSNIFCQECENSMKYHKTADNAPVISAVSYASDQTKSLIHFMKDFDDSYVFDYAAALIQEKLDSLGITDISDYYITYAPRNPKTYFKKRFDQSKEIAEFLALRIFDDSKKAIPMFKRKIFSGEQKKLDMFSRAINAKSIFKIKRNAKIPDKLIIVDDLTTTGATLYTLRTLALGAGVSECLLCTVAFNGKKYDS